MTSERMVELAEKVEREIPEITADFNMLANVDYTQRYDTLKSLARQNTHRDDWECEAVRKVYTPPPQ
jgi:predicted transcriptional regulator